MAGLPAGRQQSDCETLDRPSPRPFSHLDLHLGAVCGFLRLDLPAESLALLRLRSRVDDDLRVFRAVFLLYRGRPRRPSDRSGRRCRVCRLRLLRRGNGRSARRDAGLLFRLALPLELVALAGGKADVRIGFGFCGSWRRRRSSGRRRGGRSRRGGRRDRYWSRSVRGRRRFGVGEITERRAIAAGLESRRRKRTGSSCLKARRRQCWARRLNECRRSRRNRGCRRRCMIGLGACRQLSTDVYANVVRSVAETESKVLESVLLGFGELVGCELRELAILLPGRTEQKLPVCQDASEVEVAQGHSRRKRVTRRRGDIGGRGRRRCRGRVPDSDCARNEAECSSGSLSGIHRFGLQKREDLATE